MEYITKLICQKSNISYIVMNQELNILDFSDNIETLVDDPQALIYGADIRDVMWEFVGIEDKLMTLYENENIDLHFPMILKGSKYYDLDVELFEDSVEKYFIIYMTKKTKESLTYANSIKEMNKKTLIYQNEHKQEKEEHYNLINKRVLSFNVDLDGRITLTNDVFTHFFDIGKDDIIGKHFSTFFQTRDAKLDTKDSAILNAVDMNKKLVSFHANIIPVSKDEVIYENLIICQDITYLKEVEKELEYAVGHDSLTGVPNRSQLLKKIDEVIENAKEEKKKFFICMIDLSDLKSINDNYGHHAGDMLLKHTANILSDFLRNSDMIARVGGDEFVILFDTISSKSDIDNMIKRIKKLPKNNPLIYTKDDSIDFNYKLNVASYPKSAKTGEKLIEFLKLQSIF